MGNRWGYPRTHRARVLINVSASFRLLLSPRETLRLLTAVGVVGTILALPANALISPTAAVGATPGSFAVSPSGAATYTIPIAVAPGINGLQPHLALVYNSQGGNGLLGMGWGLAGLSVIHRCGATIELDGFKGGVNYDANDRFCLDGERLIQVGPSEFRTERESLQKVNIVGSLSDPSYFSVSDNSGTVREYGGMSHARVVAAEHPSGFARLWALNRVQDIHANYLTIAYSQDVANGQFYPAEIQYTGNSTQVQPSSFVRFVYESRPDATPSYQDSALSKYTARLAMTCPAIFGPFDS